jgi:hypothetical protein
MIQGKDKCVAQGGQLQRSGVTRQPERSGVTSQHRVLDIINKIEKIELRRAGAFVARMWLSKKENFHKRACVRFVF